MGRLLPLAGFGLCRAYVRIAGLAALYALSLPCTVVSVSALRRARDLPPSSVADCEHAIARDVYPVNST